MAKDLTMFSPFFITSLVASLIILDHSRVRELDSAGLQRIRVLHVGTRQSRAIKGSCAQTVYPAPLFKTERREVLTIIECVISDGRDVLGNDDPIEPAPREAIFLDVLQARARFKLHRL